MGENKASHDELDDVKAKTISEKEAEIVSFKASRNAEINGQRDAKRFQGRSLDHSDGDRRYGGNRDDERS
ncbi:hypothetical protein PHJA_000355500 [Phtheirospermum japonicum]|uniref:Uncharacterized protein n=1 Tax=Phtheirospermum japonicum TaxID=374723 RepID=A0A830B8C3_9LAMI|nr:hypothetical protein PHJA_000355500 [Phtheirospermum japonicum]